MPRENSKDLSEILANIECVFEDNHLMILCKPARLPVASDSSGDQTLLNWARSLQAEKNKHKNIKGYLVPVHFLDRPTSGLIIFAKSSKAASRMQVAFKTRTIEKKYLAIIEEHQPFDANEKLQLDDFLIKDHQQNIVSLGAEHQENAKKASLTAQVIQRRNDFALMEIQLGSGRSHQIRVQLSSRGWPIVGDLKYGAHAPFEHKIALHAYSLRFLHPVSKEEIFIKKRPSKDWEYFGFAQDYP